MTLPFQPTRFSVPVVNPTITTSTVNHLLPYISPSEFRFAPTAVGSADLVPLSTNQSVDSTASLWQEIMRATALINNIIFHGREASLAANIITEADYVRIQSSGALEIFCNYKPVREVLSLALGFTPITLSPIADPGSIAIVRNQVLQISELTPIGMSSTFISGLGSPNSQAYAYWQYVLGYPHTSLAQSTVAGSSTITVNYTDLTQSEVVGIDTYSLPLQLIIRDGSNTETVVVTGVNGNVLTIQSPLQYAHTIPSAPDFIPVTALPDTIERAAILLTSMFIKLRASKAMELPSRPGESPTRALISESGGGADLKIAEKMLRPYVVPVFIR